MTKADIVNEIAKSTGAEKVQVQAIVEAFMESIKGSLEKKNNVYLRGFGSFIVKKRATKVARNISKNTTITIPAKRHSCEPARPSRTDSDPFRGKRRRTPLRHRRPAKDFRIRFRPPFPEPETHTTSFSAGSGLKTKRPADRKRSGAELPTKK